MTPMCQAILPSSLTHPYQTQNLMHMLPNVASSSLSAITTAAASIAAAAAAASSHISSPSTNSQYVSYQNPSPEASPSDDLTPQHDDCGALNLSTTSKKDRSNSSE